MKKEKEYCMGCNNPNPPDKPICECGGRNFIFGSNFTYEDGEAICGCGSKEFSRTMHLNMGKYHNHNYVCKACKNKIGMQFHVGENFY